MPEINQYLLNNKELLELIIKHSGFHEGKWMLLASYGIAPGNYGPTPDETGPGIAFAFTKVGIQRAGTDTPEKMMLDASNINPPPKALKSRKKPRKRKKS